jgi:hypothetical protein
VCVCACVRASACVSIVYIMCASFHPPVCTEQAALKVGGPYIFCPALGLGRKSIAMGASRLAQWYFPLFVQSGFLCFNDLLIPDSRLYILHLRHTTGTATVSTGVRDLMAEWSESCASIPKITGSNPSGGI